MKQLRKEGFSELERNMIKDRVKKILNRDPNLNFSEAQVKALESYLKEVKTEQDSILKQVEEANA